MNGPVNLELSILELSKILIYEFWFDYIQWKYGEKSNIVFYGYIQFHCYIKTDDIYTDIAEDVETRFDSSNNELDRLLPKEKNEKVIGLMKDELDGKSWQYLLD